MAEIEFRHASELSVCLGRLGEAVRLPMQVAMRTALMRRTADTAADTWARERQQSERDREAAVRAGESERLGQLEEELRQRGRETFQVDGTISYTAISDALDRDQERAEARGESWAPPEGLANILAGIRPVLVDLPEGC